MSDPRVDNAKAKLAGTPLPHHPGTVKYAADVLRVSLDEADRWAQQLQERYAACSHVSSPAMSRKVELLRLRLAETVLLLRSLHDD